MVIKKDKYLIPYRLLFLVIVIGIVLSDNFYSYTEGDGLRWSYRQARKKSYTLASDTIREVANEVVGIHCNIISWDTFAVLTTAFPMFVGARMFDEKIQSCFYVRKDHKNINQFPFWFHDVANWAISVPIFFLAIDTFFSQDLVYCQTNETFLIGVIFVVSGKVLLKKLDFDFCLRPWHERFSKTKRASGGFPSGHMAEVTYITLVYGLRYGLPYAIPLSILALGVGMTFLNCNRHYLSQLVGGAAFGAIYAMAVHRFIDQKLSYRLTCGMSVNEYGGPCLEIKYTF